MSLRSICDVFESKYLVYLVMRCLKILLSLHLVILSTQSLVRNLDKYEKESFVVSLNFYRSAISNPTAANMNFLKWNTTLEEKATFISHECYFFMEAPPGENYDIISEAVSAKNTFIISDFFESIYVYGKKFYNFSSKLHCKNLPGSYRMCNYFKMAFARYRSFGCNVAYCPHYGNRIRACLKSCISIVCLFSPSSRDNVFREYGHELMVQPYKEGPSCSQCFSNHGLCISKLCRSHPPCEEVPGCDKLMVSTCFCSIGCRLWSSRMLYVWTIPILSKIFF